MFDSGAVLRAVVDTNVWISALLNPHGAPARLLPALELSLFDLVVSEALMSELRGVLSRPRLAVRFGVTPAKIEYLVGLLLQYGRVVPVTGVVRVCRDRNDDMVIETAINGKAQVLVSRDDDLKRDLNLITSLDSLGIRVLTVRNFLELLDQASSQ